MRLNCSPSRSSSIMPDRSTVSRKLPPATASVAATRRDSGRASQWLSSQPMSTASARARNSYFQHLAVKVG
ncbi:hypothetical protein [Desulfoscipio gibsoniae]|uniref:hypothetical protein n=1 Tax=Desulfoscipio gibsoniae TaxID=102134 RepID=UPI0012FF3EA2|nr:hypothetical protein [Desulfoscipio gibsoniae]